MKIFLVAYDSYGVRSMATYLKLGKTSIFLDPGVALGPRRYGLPPTNPELLAESICRRKIMELCQKAGIVFVSHYHYDHHPFPEDEEMYVSCFKDKIVLAKDIKRDVNLSAKKRGKVFEDNVKDLVAELHYADNQEFHFGNVFIKVSPAVWHGEENSKVGKVIMLYLEYKNSSFLFGSDAQSLADKQALNFVIENNPDFLIVDGYPTLFVGWKFSKRSLGKATENLKKAIEKTDAEIIILEHHLVRDLNYKEKVKEVFELAKESGKKILNAAEYHKVEPLYLEARRKEISQGIYKPDVREFFQKLYSKFR